MSVEIHYISCGGAEIFLTKVLLGLGYVRLIQVDSNSSGWWSYSILGRPVQETLFQTSIQSIQQRSESGINMYIELYLNKMKSDLFDNVNKQYLNQCFDNIC